MKFTSLKALIKLKNLSKTDQEKRETANLWNLSKGKIIDVAEI